MRGECIPKASAISAFVKLLSLNNVAWYICIWFRLWSMQWLDVKPPCHALLHNFVLMMHKHVMQTKWTHSVWTTPMQASCSLSLQYVVFSCLMPPEPGL